MEEDVNYNDLIVNVNITSFKKSKERILMDDNVINNRNSDR